ncbi:hypothetical protein AWC38_SpisGene25639, partial [Stylophora pistillata]
NRKKQGRVRILKKKKKKKRMLKREKKKQKIQIGLKEKN